MTKEEARQFKDRWQLVNDRINDEIRQMPLSAKLEQLAVMFAAGRSLGWTDEEKRGEEEVRQRWIRLKEKMHE